MFSRQDNLLKQLRHCTGHRPPPPPPQLQLLAPFVVYADSELILQRVGDEAMDTIQGVAAGGEDPSKSTSNAALHTRW